MNELNTSCSLQRQNNQILVLCIIMGNVSLFQESKKLADILMKQYRVKQQNRKSEFIFFFFYLKQKPQNREPVMSEQ